MILFCGIPTEPPLALAIAAAEAMGVEHAVLNQRHAAFCDIALDVHGADVGGRLWTSEREWPLEAFSGAYTRLVENSVLPESRPRRGVAPDPARVAKAGFVVATLGQWLEIAPCRVVNPSWAMASNGSKPYQAQKIAEAGLATPPTLVTNDEDEVAAFARRHGRVVYKSISAVRSIVREWTPGAGPPLRRIRDLPTQFQAFIPGVNVRVHVVGREVFATEIASEAVDYRYAGRDGLEATMSPADLPPDVAAACLAVSASLSLPFCGIDLKRTPQGLHYCFEVNPSPAYSYYEENAGQPIARALVAWLAGSAPAPKESTDDAGRRELGGRVGSDRLDRSASDAP
jgi:hypothetical protein